MRASMAVGHEDLTWEESLLAKLWYWQLTENIDIKHNSCFINTDIQDWNLRFVTLKMSKYLFEKSSVLYKLIDKIQNSKVD